MIKQTEVKLWHDINSGNFSQRPIDGAAYIISFKDVDVTPKRVAYIDISASMSPIHKHVNDLIAHAKASGAVEYNFFTDTIQFKDNFPIDASIPKDLELKNLRGATKIDWVKTLPKDIIPILYTDGEISNDPGEFLRTLWNSGALVCFLSMGSFKGFSI